MDLHQSIPPPYNNLFQSPPTNPLQRSRSLQFPGGPVTSNFHPLNAPQSLQPSHGYAQQHFLQQQQQQQQHQQQQQQQQQRSLGTSNPAHVAPVFAPHPNQRTVHSPAHLVTQHNTQQQYNLPVHHVVHVQQPVAPIQARPLDIRSQTEANSQSPKQEYEKKTDAHLEGLKLVPDPPDLQTWRQRLFDVDDMIVVSEEHFQVYFPHVDNVYSHRSTQKYKKKPFISHYWDCRLKGRPAGTAKSDDPNKKKRKRVARERDLCDVKIKITEYLPGATRDEIAGHLSQQPRKDGIGVEQLLTMVESSPGVHWNNIPEHYTEITARFYTIQRVNGTGPNGKEEGAGAHRHNLEDSDKIKKNSVVRWLQKSNKEPPKRKVQEKKSYHTKATGAALATVKKHSKDHSLKLYGGCFCPFVQRVWISLEVKQLAYQYIEIDPYKKPEWYLKLNPRGLIPTLQDGDWCCGESTVLMEYLEDIGQGQPLLPSDPKQKALCRLWSDHINRNIIPAFYRYIQEQDPQKQAEKAGDFKNQISKLVDAADKEGPFFLGSQLGFVDVQFAPWIIRLNRVLKPYRGWPNPESNSRFAKWVQAIEDNEHVKATTSTDELYLDSYERYAENRPNTSQVADAVNSGRGLP